MDNPRFILFGYDSYYPFGGSGDEQGRFLTIEAAEDFIVSLIELARKGDNHVLRDSYELLSMDSGEWLSHDETLLKFKIDDIDGLRNLVLACREYYSNDENVCGGWLHIVLDDGNLEDGFVEHCIADAQKNNDPAGIHLGNMILAAPLSLRRRLYANYKEYSATGHHTIY